MENNISNIESLLPRKVSIVICLKCYKKWRYLRPENTKLKDLECSECGQGYIIETGEDIGE